MTCATKSPLWRIKLHQAKRRAKCLVLSRPEQPTLYPKVDYSLPSDWRMNPTPAQRLANYLEKLETFQRVA